MTRIELDRLLATSPVVTSDVKWQGDPVWNLSRHLSDVLIRCCAAVCDDRCTVQTAVIEVRPPWLSA